MGFDIQSDCEVKILRKVIFKILLAVLLLISGVLIGLIGEVIGGDLQKHLSEMGYTPKHLYVTLLVFTIISVACIVAYEVLEGKEDVFRFLTKARVRSALKYILISIGVIVGVPIIGLFLVIILLVAITAVQNNNIENTLEIASVYNQGIDCYERQNFDCSFSNLTDVIGRNSNSELKRHAFLFRSLTLLKKGDDEKSELDFRQAIKLGVDETTGYIEKGKAYYQIGKDEKALESFTIATNKSPQNYLAFVALGGYYYYKNDDVKALECLEKAININPNFAQSYANRALVFKRMGDLKKYEEDKNKAESLAQNQ